MNNLGKFNGECTLSIRMIKQFYVKFRGVRTCSSDAKRSGLPIEVATLETLEKNYEMVSDINPLLSLRCQLFRALPLYDCLNRLYHTVKCR